MSKACGFPVFSKNSPRETQVRYAFDPFELDTSTLELRRGGEPVSVEPQVFELLAYLIENRDRVLSKDDLIAAVWGGRIVSDAAIASRIRLARRAVDDDGARQAVIKTVHGKGFRFVGALKDETAPPDDGSRRAPEIALQEPERSPLAPPNRVLTRLGLVAAGLLGLFLLIQLFPGGGAGDTARIAVLPVANDTGDASLDWAELGLMSLVIHDLEARSELPLVPARTVMTLSDRFAEDARETLSPSQPLQDALRDGYGATHILISRLSGPADNLTLEYRMVNPRGQSPPGRLSGQLAAELAAQMSRQVAATLPRSGERRLDVPLHMFDDVYVAETFARGRDLQMNGHGAKAADMFRAAAAQAPDNLTIRYELAVSTRIAGDFESADAQLKDLVEAAQTAGDVDVHGSALNGLGVLHLTLRDDETALGFFQAAIDVLETSENSHKLATALTNLGVIHRRLRNYNASEEALGRALIAYEAAGFETPPGHLFNALALLKAQTRDVPRSIAYLNDALSAFRLVGNRRAEAVVLHNLGAHAHDFGEYIEAERLLSDALALRRDMDDRRGQISSLTSLARLSADRGDAAGGATHAQDVLQLAAALDDAYQTAQAEGLAAHIAFMRGDWVTAAAHSETAHAGYISLSRTRKAYREVIRQAVIAGYAGSLDGFDALSEVLAWAEAETQKGTELLTHEALAILYLLDGDYAQAAAHLDTAVGLSNALHLSAVTGRIAARQGIVRFMRGDVTGATASLGRAKAGFSQHQETVLLSALIERASGDSERSADLIAEAQTIAGDTWHLSKRLFSAGLDHPM